MSTITRTPRRAAKNKVIDRGEAVNNPPTTHWRPQQNIQTKVIAICINRRRLLAAEVYNDAGEIKGVRPLGGHVEFGETREQALVREFREELGTEIVTACLLYTSPSPRDLSTSRMPSSA